MSVGTLAGNSRRNRVVVLCGPRVTHRHTCATLISSGANVVGICIADQRTSGLPLSYVLRSCKRKGIGRTFSRVVARMAYSLMNSRKDNAAFSRIFDRRSIDSVLTEWGGDIHHARSYSDSETLAWLKEKQPDVLVVHSPYWIGKAVRQIPATGIVLGGHPGITPQYRGSHSSFWAIYRGQPQDVGCTVFLINEGVDTGDIVAQENVPIESGDSYVTLSWKGMARIAELQAQVLRGLDQGVSLPRRKVTVPPESEFDSPTLREFFEYRSLQQQVR